MGARKVYTNIDWKPQPRQMKFLRACGLSHPFEKRDEKGGVPQPKPPVAKVVGYGGAAGGG